MPSTAKVNINNKLKYKIMKFIKLRLCDGTEVFANMNLAFDIYKNPNADKSNTHISFGNDYVLTVLETPKEVIDLISEL